MTGGMDPALARGNRFAAAESSAEHVLWGVADGVSSLTLNRPERKDPISFEPYARTRDGGDVHEIIGPPIRPKAPELPLLARMRGDPVRAVPHCPQPIVASIEGVCAAAGAILAMASRLPLGNAPSMTAFLFNRVGLACCAMGAPDALPRIIGPGRAAQRLCTGGALGVEEPPAWGFLNRQCEPETLLADAQPPAKGLARGPTRLPRASPRPCCTGTGGRASTQPSRPNRRRKACAGSPRTSRMPITRPPRGANPSSNATQRP